MNAEPNPNGWSDFGGKDASPEEMLELADELERRASEIRARFAGMPDPSWARRCLPGLFSGN